MQYLTEIYCKIDDFYKKFEPMFAKRLITSGKKTRNRKSSVSIPEIATIVTMFHIVRFRHFKSFYLSFLKPFFKHDFPNLPSYNRFVELVPRALPLLSAFFNAVKGQCTGISFIDSTKLVVCHNRRIHDHQVFAKSAQRGKSSTGWFYGFKLHYIINHLGEILSLKLTKGNVDDRVPVLSLATNIHGILTADKGYLGAPLTQALYLKGIQFITSIRKNMKKVTRTGFEWYLLQHRALIETVNDQLKNLCQIEHSRHRSESGFLVNLMSGIIAYCLSPNKPKLPLQCVNAIAKM